jgi:hypothetical protein
VKLNQNQHQVIMQLGNEPVILGFAETVAYRLCKPNKSRDALCRSVGSGGFVLTDAGRAYQRASEVL